MISVAFDSLPQRGLMLIETIPEQRGLQDRLIPAQPGLARGNHVLLVDGVTWKGDDPASFRAIAFSFNGSPPVGVFVGKKQEYPVIDSHARHRFFTAEQMKGWLNSFKAKSSSGHSYVA